jgi:hypothetical protein
MRTDLTYPMALVPWLVLASAILPALLYGTAAFLLALAFL